MILKKQLERKNSIRLASTELFAVNSTGEKGLSPSFQIIEIHRKY